jgi:hypothetical protein
VHWIGGEKGGVGKSVVARLLVQYWIDRAIAFRAFDTDRSHGALLRYYSGYAEPLDPTRFEELDRIVDAIEEPVEEVVVDLAAQTESDVEAWLASGEVIPLFERLGHELWWWYVIDDGKDSVRLLSRRLDRLERGVHPVCVLNRGRGRDFMLFDEAKLADRVLQRGGDLIEIPELHPRSMLKMDAYDKSFWAAIHNEDPEEGPCLARMERERAKVFIRRSHDAFRRILNPTSG